MAIIRKDTSQLRVAPKIAVTENPAQRPNGLHKSIKVIHPDFDLSVLYESLQTGPYTMNMACDRPLTNLMKRFN